MSSNLSNNKPFLFTLAAVAASGVLYFNKPTIEKVLNSNFSKQEEKCDIGKNFLKEEFFAFKNNESFIFANDNFWMFADIIHEIDNSIHFKRSEKLDFKNNTIYIPFNFQYKDIPVLLNIIKTNIKSPFFENIIKEIQDSYLKRAYYLLEVSKWSKFEKMYTDSALKLFTVYMLFKWESKATIIENEFKQIFSQKIHDEEIKNEIYNSVKSVEARLEVKNLNNFEPWKIWDKEIKTIIDTIRIDQNKWLGILKENVWAYIDKLPIKNRTFLKSYINTFIDTNYKVFAIIDQDSADYNKDAINKIIGRIGWILKNKDIIKTQEFENRLQGYLDYQINKSTQIELKRNLEKTLYYTMINDFSLKWKVNESAINSVKNINKKYIEADFFDDYIKWNFSKEKEKKHRINWKSSKEIVAEILPKIEYQELCNFVESLYNTFDSKHFQDIKENIWSWNFEKAKNILAWLDEKEKLNCTYILMSNIWYDIKTKMFKNKYNAHRFEITNLKKNPSNWRIKYNCQAISAVWNYIIENLLWIKWLGINLSYNPNWKSWHMLNVVKIWDKLICIDITNNIYYIKSANKFNNNYFWD